MSFWKSLFGGGGASSTSAPKGPVRSEEYEGYLIEATPYMEGGQYQVSGTISKEIGGERKVHTFVRADRCPGIEDAADISIRKGKQIVDQVGEGIFK
jgi:hypothetical protein